MYLCEVVSPSFSPSCVHTSNSLLICVQWERFFSKKLNGVRVQDVKQKVVFRGKAIPQMFALLSDFRQLGKVFFSSVVSFPHK